MTAVPKGYAPMFMRSVVASQRFGNVAMKADFVDDTKPKHLYSLVSNPQAVALYDLTGDNTGIPGSTLTGDDDINFDSSCTSGSPGSSAIVCKDYKVGTGGTRTVELHATISRCPSSGGKVSSCDLTFQVVTIKDVLQTTFELGNLALQGFLRSLLPRALAIGPPADGKRTSICVRCLQLRETLFHVRDASCRVYLFFYFSLFRCFFI